MRRTLLILAVLSATTAQASQPFNASLVPGVSVFSKNTRIEGFILNLWGQNPQTALAIGVVNGSTGQSSGLSLAFIANYADSYTGAHLGFVNFAKGQFIGLQWGAVNYAGRMKGLQLGVVNFAKDMDGGVQIGLVNVIQSTRSWFSEFPRAVAPFFLIANWRF